jgi:CRP-like cAMP-binding protein
LNFAKSGIEKSRCNCVFIGILHTFRQFLNHLLRVQKEGDFFGEQALLTNDPRNATVVALTAVDLLRFSKPDLEAIMRTYPRIGDMLQHYHQQRNTRTIASLTSVLQPTEADR